MSNWDVVKELRDVSGMALMECKKVLEEAKGNKEEALNILKKRGLLRAEKKQERQATKGRIGSYVHTNGKIGVLVELACESDFVANTDDFKELLNDLCLQVCAMNPIVISREELPQEAIDNEKQLYLEEVKNKPPQIAEKIIEGKLEKFFYSQKCLLDQIFIKDMEGKQNVSDLIKMKISKLGENIIVKRFVRFELGV